MGRRKGCLPARRAVAGLLASRDVDDHKQPESEECTRNPAAGRRVLLQGPFLLRRTRRRPKGRTHPADSAESSHRSARLAIRERAPRTKGTVATGYGAVSFPFAPIASVVTRLPAAPLPAWFVASRNFPSGEIRSALGCVATAVAGLSGESVWSGFTAY
jgi:hypothetical protein